MSTDGRGQINWDAFLEYIRRGLPIVHRIEGKSNADLFVENSGRRIGLRLALDDTIRTDDLSMAHIQVDVVRVDGVLNLEVSTTERDLYQDFFGFITAVADRVQVNGRSPGDALKETIERWKGLLRAIAILSEEEQVGLWGELWVLNKLITLRGPSAVQSWIGPEDEPHDFRWTAGELEVKTTRSNRRVHTIRGLAQLEPSPDHSLHLLSLQIASPGSGIGTSLVSQVKDTRALLATSASDLEEFERKLALVGYRENDATKYGTAFQLSSNAVFVPVTPELPRITKSLLTANYGESGSRIESAEYRLNVDGLGVYGDLSAFWQNLGLGDIERDG